MFGKIQFEPGGIVYDDMQIDPNKSLESQVDNLKEDLFQVNYADKFIVDVGWFPSLSKDGHFRVVAIEDFDWESPVFQKTCRTLIELREYVEEAVSIVKMRL
ncbi:hypothetical protein [Paenibacillus woosongensis]|uniref:Uncharacterized protein n=1 Tax=Paenibacillus woosongensis TaxID=307580 RepID=A0A7X2Z5T1_9BACL|nr:hypothetical protein [Paenibacillus woosongensis]MUG48052.1 hypothetical protein [Paenibacillus woosongensis]